MTKLVGDLLIIIHETNVHNNSYVGGYIFVYVRYSDVSFLWLVVGRPIWISGSVNFSLIFKTGYIIHVDV